MKNSIVVNIFCLIILLSASPSLSQEAISYRISWNPITDPSVSEVRIFRSLTGNPGDFAYLASVPVATTEYTDSGLEEGQQYYYCLKSANAFGGESGYSAAVSGLTLGESNSEAEKDRCRVNTITKLTDTSCRVEWTTLSSSTGKVIYWSLGVGGVTGTPVTTNPATSHSTDISGLDPDRVYMLRAVAYDGSGDLTRSTVNYYSSSGQGTGDVEFLTSAGQITVPENGTAQFGVRLNAAPAGLVRVIVMRTSGDTDIEVQSGALIEFNPGDWDTYKTVTLSAGDDRDLEDGEAVIVVGTAGGDVIVPTVYVTAYEDDDDTAEGPSPSAAQVAVYPIPFRPDEGPLNIQNLPERGSINIIDLKGRRVWKKSWDGRTSLEWDGRNSRNMEIAAGRYFVLIKDGSGSVIDKKAILAVR